MSEQQSVFGSFTEAAHRLAVAQVHATLAVAEAVANRPVVIDTLTGLQAHIMNQTVDSSWVEVDHESGRSDPLPPLNTWVWVNELFYRGVEIGQYDGNTWSVPGMRRGDLLISHWAPMAWPEPPDVPEPEEVS